MDSKQLASVEIKDETKGEVEAVFATLNVKDRDDDVTLPGAFENGSEVVISAYGHKSWEGVLPVGKGTISEVGDKVVMKGRFFLNTTAGRDTFEVVKELGARQEWSYGFNVLDSEAGEFEGKSVRVLKKMAVHEVSPVMRGAGVGTTTTLVKALADEMAKADLSAEGRRREADNGEALPDGSFPIANRRDLENAIHAIGRAKNEAAAKAHIIKRARALGLTDLLPDGWVKSFNEEVSFAVAAVRDVVESAGRVAALRAEKGKELSQVNKDGLVELSKACEQLKALLNAEDTKEDNDATDELNSIWLGQVAATLEGE